MAKTRVKGSTGSFTVAGIIADMASFSDEVSQQVDDTSNYTDPPAFTSCSGSGCSTHNISFAGFINYAATTTAPGLASLPGDPAAFTATLATGCTYTGNAVIERAGLAARKVAGAIALTGSMRSSGTVVETWATM